MSIKDGLKQIIDLVTALDDSTEFQMNSYCACVLGQTVGLKYKSEIKTIKKVFGVEPVLKNLEPELQPIPDDGGVFWYEAPLSQDAQTRWSSPVWTDDDWKVIRLFTSAIGGIITKQKWLEMANKELERLG